MKTLILSILLSMAFTAPVVAETANTVNELNESAAIIREGSTGGADENDYEGCEEPVPIQVTTYNSYREAYFNGLTNNLGMNYRGSCGYVALGMILSYYDNYLNDSIVPDNFDITSTGNGTNMVESDNSPGILKDELTNGATMTSSAYISEMYSMASKSLHSYLITIGKDLNYYNYNPKEKNTECLTFCRDRVNILKEYLTRIGIEESNYSIEYVIADESNDRSVRNFIETNINNGYPVVIGVNPRAYNDNEGHVLVGYEITNGKVYGHDGYAKKLATHIPVYDYYKHMNNAMVIKFKYSHTHTDNYEVKDYSGTHKYCYCNSNIMTYSSVMTKFDEPENFSGSLIIPNWVTSIGNNVFKNNNKLTQVGFNEDSAIEVIGEYAFANCTNLMGIDVPPNLKKVSKGAFSGCTSLGVFFTMPYSKLNTIEDLAFENCKRLHDILIPHTVKTITGKPFFGCNTYLYIMTEIAAKPQGWSATWNAIGIDQQLKDYYMSLGGYYSEEHYCIFADVQWGGYVEYD